MARYPNLEQVARRLKNSSPDLHRDLITALNEVHASVLAALVTADPAAIFVVQGRAQQVNDLLSALEPPETQSPKRSFVPFSA